MSIPDLIKARLQKERPMTEIPLHLPVDVIESLKAIAPLKGYSDFTALLKSYIGEGLRRDEERYAFGEIARLIAALKEQGVSDTVIAQATRTAHETRNFVH